MHFAVPSAYFAFLGLAAIPLILYLLFRRKKKDVPWAATYILRRTLQRQFKADIWKRYIIVAIRTLAFIALPLVFLLPYLDWHPPEEGAFPQAPPSTHRLILLDLSRSMTASYGTGTCLDAAVGLCRKIMAAGTFPGRLDVLPLDGRDSPTTFEALPLPHQQVEAALGRLKVSAEPCRFEDGLRTALRQFRASHYEKKEMFVLSDFSARDLESSQSYAGLLRPLRSAGVRNLCLSYENPQASNFALLEMTPELDLLLAGEPTIFYLTVGYYGTRTSADTWLSLLGPDGETLFEDTLSLAPGEKTLEIPITLTGSEQALKAVLKEDDLPLDDTIERSYRVRDELRLAVVQNLDMRTGFENPREWLKLALDDKGGGAPRSILRLKHIQDHMRSRGRAGEIQDALGAAETQESRGKIAVDYVITSQAGKDLLSDRDGVVFVDVDTVPEGIAEALHLYIVRGGTVILAPGPSAKANRFNQSFRSVLPAALGEPAKEEIDPDTYHHAILEFPQNRIFRELEAANHGHISNARFYNYYDVAHGSLAEDATVLFSLSNGAPLLLSRTIGRGTCLLLTAGIGGDWQSMVVHPAYLVFFRRMFNLAASRRGFALNLRPGQPILRRVERKQVSVVLPSGKRESVQTRSAGPTRYLRYDRTETPGLYVVYPEPGSTDIEYRYHVTEDRHESDYRPLTDNARAAFEQLMHSPLYATEEALAEAVGGTYEGTPLSPQAALILLCLLLAEAGLARRWFG